MMFRLDTRHAAAAIAIATMLGAQAVLAQPPRPPHYEIEPLKPVRQPLMGEGPARTAIFDRLTWKARPGGPNAGTELFYLTQVAITLVQSSDLTPKREVNFYARLTSNNVHTVNSLQDQRSGVFLSIRLFDKFGGPLTNSLPLGLFNVGCKDNERTVAIPNQTISSPGLVNIFDIVSAVEIANVGYPQESASLRYLQADGCTD